MIKLYAKSRHVTIGYFTCSGNICPQDGMYSAANDNVTILCLRGEPIPKVNGVCVGMELTDYLPTNVIPLRG